VTKIENQTFENVVVNFDGYQYHKCVFNHCQLLYTGMTPAHLVDCQIRSDCMWGFGGPAQNTLSFLKDLYKSSPASKALVEAILQTIRGEAPPQQPFAPPDSSKGLVH